MNDSILFQNNLFCIWINNADLTFELVKNGESFTLFCELTVCPITNIISKVSVYDYDGCFDFNRQSVLNALTQYNQFIEVDFSEL